MEPDFVVRMLAILCTGVHVTKALFREFMEADFVVLM
jgi:hypothetical protein